MASSCSLDRITYTYSGNRAVSILPVLGTSLIIHPSVFIRCSVFMFVAFAVCSQLLWEEVIHNIPISFFMCVCVCARACVITAFDTPLL
jgi:hypothetical protein